MIILKPISTQQTLRFIQTREGVANKLVLINETTNEKTEYSVTVSNVSFYNEITKSLTLKEGHFYVFNLMQGDVVLHSDKIFCTAQDIDAYTVNKDEYVVNNQDIIFYE